MLAEIYSMLAQLMFNTERVEQVRELRFLYGHNLHHPHFLH
jgi:hypothetical protein